MSRAACIALLLILAACAGTPEEPQIAAAASLRDALAEVGGAVGEPLRFHFAASGVLLHQAEEGAPFDVVAFAGELEMDRLERAGLLEPGTRTVFATNRLVLAVPRDVAPPRSLEELAGPGYGRIALGTPETVPAGRYAREVLQEAALWETIEPRLVYAGDVRGVVAYLERGEVDAGFVYRTDLEGASGVGATAVLDGERGPSIRYVAAVLRDAAAPEAARRFVRFLAGPRAEVVLRRHGFGAPR